MDITISLIVNCIFNTLCIFSIPLFSQSLYTYSVSDTERKCREKESTVKMKSYYVSNVPLNKYNFV